ncbi:hypothetical protein, partial [Micromonospora sp. NPDC057140]
HPVPPNHQDQVLRLTELAGFWTKEVEIGGHTLELGAQVSRSGGNLHMQDLMVFVKGQPAEQMERLGATGVADLKRQVMAWAREDGIESISISGKRVTPGVPRRPFNYVIDVATGRMRSRS